MAYTDALKQIANATDRQTDKITMSYLPRTRKIRRVVKQCA